MELVNRIQWLIGFATVIVNFLSVRGRSIPPYPTAFTISDIISTPQSKNPLFIASAVRQLSELKD